MAQWMSGFAGVLLAIVGQGVNVWLNLKLRNAILESEARTLDKVAEDYKRKDVCEPDMDGLEKRVCLLVDCPLRRAVN